MPWLPYVVGAAAGSLVTVAVVALFGGFDSTGGRSTGASTSTNGAPATSAPSTTLAQGAFGSPPAILGFGIASSNCPSGVASTTVRVTYQTRDAATVSFTVDGGSPSPAPDTSGSRDVGPIPCDAQPHVVTLIAESNGQRATRQATVTLS